MTDGSARKRSSVSLSMLLVLLNMNCSATPARCGYADFSIGAAHMTNPIGRPFVVRKVRGRFVPAFADVSHAVPWIPAEDRFRLQLNGPNGFSVVIPVAPNGSFETDSLPPGQYCFHTSSDYMQGYDGIVVVDPTAEDRPIVIQVAIGV